MGGMPAGPLDLAEHEAEPWAKLITAILGAMREHNYTTVDEMRRALEGLPTADYDRPYFERWAEAMCNLFEEKEFLDRETVERRMAELEKQGGGA